MGSKGFRGSAGGYPIVLLIPARTDTAYFHDYIYGKAEIRFVRGRLRFTDDDACNGDYGVRPLCNLKSEILVSYLNGENAEEQKKRAEAVDMMKHIAAAWDIDAEEVFGRADE